MLLLPIITALIVIVACGLALKAAAWYRGLPSPTLLDLAFALASFIVRNVFLHDSSQIMKYIEELKDKNNKEGKAERKNAFLLFGDLHVELQEEIVARVDPVTRSFFAFTSKSNYAKYKFDIYPLERMVETALKAFIDGFSRERHRNDLVAE